MLKYKTLIDMAHQPNIDRTTTTPLCNVDLHGVSFSNTMQETTKKLVEGLQIEREKVIKDRLNKLGIELDIELEKRRRFKSLNVEHRNNEETIYYNNGTEQGLRVITFVYMQTPFDYDSVSIKCELKYY